MPEDTKVEFPSDFLWGASVAAHQVEGGNHNQWTEWEKAHADELAATAERRISWMPGWKSFAEEAKKPATYISGSGVDHYHRYTEDFKLLKKINLNSFRFSIEWSRLEPEEGQWNQTEVDHYHAYIKELRALGIEPVLNIWHWTNPIWFERKGAFKHKRNLKYFDRFVQKISEEYGNHLKYIITLNEPNVYTTFGYFAADTASGSPWPPGEKNFLSLMRVYWNLIKAHKRAYQILKRDHPHLQIGTAQQLANIQAKNPHDLVDEISTKFMRYAWNWFFLHRIRAQQDFVGVNYYFTDYYTGLLKKRSPKMPLNDLGWYMEPEGLYPILLRAWAHYKKPIIITENGVADAQDEYRRWWIEETIVAMERALSEGIDVRGYMHWSLLDNFEWTNGWLAKFGLIEVDRARGMERKIRPSAKWYSEHIQKLSALK